MKNNLVSVVWIVGSLFLASCSENRVEFTNQSDWVLQDVRLSASWGEAIWRGSLKPAETETICFPSRTDGILKLEIVFPDGGVGTREFTYMTPKGDTRTKVFIRKNKVIDIESGRAGMWPYHWFCGVFPKPWKKTATGWQ